MKNKDPSKQKFGFPIWEGIYWSRIIILHVSDIKFKDSQYIHIKILSKGKPQGNSPLSVVGNTHEEARNNHFSIKNCSVNYTSPLVEILSQSCQMAFDSLSEVLILKLVSSVLVSCYL